VSFLVYGIVAAAVSRHGPAGAPDSVARSSSSTSSRLNEELVIGASLDRLLANPQPDSLVLVIDDGSDDATARHRRRPVGP